MIYDSFLDFGSKNFIEIGGFSIAWYAVCILTGILLAYFMGAREAKRFGISKNIILDGVLICVPLAIIGARLYYVITKWSEFYIEGDFVQTFFNIIGYSTVHGFQLRGLAINGGIIVAIIFVIIYCKVRKVNVFQIFDLLAPGLLIGQICGRWGNFFNQEAHGPIINPETLEWMQQIIPSFIMDKMYFVDEEISLLAQWWHPTFLYESLWNIVGLTIILISRRKNKHQRIGDSVCFYLIWYGLGRAFIIEPLRMDPLLFIESLGIEGPLFNRVNVVINLLLALAGIIWLILKHVKFKEPYYIETLEEVKKHKIDGVIFRIDETMVSVAKLLENAYYYTAKEKLNLELTDEQLHELIDLNPEEYFKDPEALLYFNHYFNSHLDQLQVVLECKDFFKSLFKYDYHVCVVTKYDKKFAEEVLERLNITAYVSIIISNTTSLDLAFNAVKEANNILVVSSRASDIIEAQNHNADSCLVYYGKEIDLAVEKEPTHIINRIVQLDDIIIL